MGLKREETRRRIAVIREKAKGQDDAQIARKLQCAPSEVRDLWASYITFRKIDRRTGKKED
jgi:DNA-binding NarL/FixJ family response regulator